VRVYWPAVGPSHRILPSPVPRIAYSDDDSGLVADPDRLRAVLLLGAPTAQSREGPPTRLAPSRPGPRPAPAARPNQTRRLLYLQLSSSSAARSEHRPYHQPGRSRPPQ
jgi:hypothetical protein